MKESVGKAIVNAEGTGFTFHVSQGFIKPGSHLSLGMSDDDLMVTIEERGEYYLDAKMKVSCQTFVEDNELRPGKEINVSCVF